MVSRTVCQLNRSVGQDSECEYIKSLQAEVFRLEQLCGEQKQKLEQYELKLSQTRDMMSVLQVKAEQDTLTGLYNPGTTRRLVEEYLAATEPQGSCALVMIDIDNFKQVNDRYGHMTGNQLLVCAASIIKKLFRAHDIVGRVGGDEFLVLMKEVPDCEIVRRRCDQLVSAFQGISCGPLNEGTLSCSVGVALSSECGRRYDHLFCCADQAMYQSKGHGGNRFTVYSGD